MTFSLHKTSKKAGLKVLPITRSVAETLHDAAELIGMRIESLLSRKVDPEKETEPRKRVKDRTS